MVIGYQQAKMNETVKRQAKGSADTGNTFQDNLGQTDGTLCTW